MYCLGCVCKPYLPRPILLSSLGVENVEGVTMCDSELYVVLCRHNTVYVYSQNTHQQQDNNEKPLRKIIVRGLADPRDIVACPETRQLFIADYYTPTQRISSGSVRRISMTGTTTDYFIVGEEKDRIKALSICPKSQQLLVTCKVCFIII